jgi:hypothetical protein
MTTTVGIALEADLGDLRSQIAAAREMLRTSSENMRQVLGRGEAAFRSFANASGLSFAATARSSTALNTAATKVDRYAAALRSSTTDMDRFRSKQELMMRAALAANATGAGTGSVYRVPTYSESPFLQNLYEAYHAERRMPDGSAQQSDFRKVVDSVSGGLSQLQQVMSAASSRFGDFFSEMAADADKAGADIASGIDGQASPALRGALGDAADARIVFGGLAGAARLAGFGVALVAGGIAATIPAFIEAEKQTQSLEFAFRASGNAAGATVERVDALAAALHVSANATRGEVVAAAASLTKVGSVIGPSFDRTITLAKDWSATFGGSTASAAEFLGKALKDPVKGLDELAAAGVAFTSAERALVAGLADGGNAAQAQAAVLDQLQSKIGGNGAAAAGGVAGAFSAAASSTSEFVKTLLDVSGISPGIIAMLNAVAIAADAVRRSMSGMGQGGGYGEQRSILDQQIAAARQEISDLEASGKAIGYTPTVSMDAAKARLDELIASSQALDQANQGAAAAWQKAQDDAKAAAADRQWRETKTAIDGVTTSLEGVATKGEKVAKIHSDAAKTVAGLRRALALATTDEQRAAIEAAISTAGEVEKRKVAALDTGGSRSQGRSLDGFESAIVTQQARTAKMVEEAKLLGDATHALDAYRVRLDLEAAAKRSGIPISDEMAARIAKEAENYRAAAVEVDRYKELIKTADEGRSDIKAFASTFTSDMLRGKSAVESLADAVQRLRDKLAGRLEDTILDAILGKAGSANSGLSSLWGLFSGSSGGITGQPGPFSFFSSFFGSSAAAAPINLTAGTAAASGGGMNLFAWLASLFHTGGTAGAASSYRSVSPSMFAGAPRFHTGLLPGELPAILLKGEAVLNTGLTDRIGSTMGGLADMAANSNYIGGTYAPTIHVNTMGSSGNTTADRQHAAMLKKELRGMLDAHFAESVTRQSQPGGVLAGAAAALKA